MQNISEMDDDIREILRQLLVRREKALHSMNESELMEVFTEALSIYLNKQQQEIKAFSLGK